MIHGFTYQFGNKGLLEFLLETRVLQHKNGTSGAVGSCRFNACIIAGDNTLSRESQRYDRLLRYRVGRDLRTGAGLFVSSFGVIHVKSDRRKQRILVRSGRQWWQPATVG